MNQQSHRYHANLPAHIAAGRDEIKKALDAAWAPLNAEIRATYDLLREPLKALGLDTHSLDIGAKAIDDDNVGDGSEHVLALEEAQQLVIDNFQGDLYSNFMALVIRFEALLRLSIAQQDAEERLRHLDTVSLY